MKRMKAIWEWSVTNQGMCGGKKIESKSEACDCRK